MKNLNLNTALLLAVTVLVTLQVKSCLSPTPVSREVIEAEIKLKQYQEERPLIIKERDDIERKYDSLLAASQTRYNNLEQQKAPIRYAIKEVPIVIGNFDREQLRRSFSNY